MLLSYYKGGLITENNVFVFSSPALVTQCCVCKPPATFQPGTQESHQVPAIDRIACNSGTPGLYWSTAKWGVKEKAEWSFTCLMYNIQTVLETRHSGVIRGNFIQFVQNVRIT